MADGLREIVLDTETTGFHHQGDDRIVEIGAVETVDGRETGNNFHVYLDPERSVSEGAFKVHGLSAESLKGKPRFRAIAREFLDFIGDTQLVAHNSVFDIGFLNAELARCRLPPLKNPVVDTLRMAKLKFGANAHNSLDALIAKYGIDGSGRTLHGALLDATLLVSVYWNLSDRDKLIKQEAPVVERVETPVSASKYALGMDGAARQSWFPARPARLPDETEEQRHAAFVAEIQNAIWAAEPA